MEEIFPQVYRDEAVRVVYSIGTLGGIFAPFTMNMLKYYDVRPP